MAFPWAAVTAGLGLADRLGIFGRRKAPVNPAKKWMEMAVRNAFNVASTTDYETLDARTVEAMRKAWDQGADRQRKNYDSSVYSSGRDRENLDTEHAVRTAVLDQAYIQPEAELIARLMATRPERQQSLWLNPAGATQSYWSMEQDQMARNDQARQSGSNAIYQILQALDASQKKGANSPHTPPFNPNDPGIWRSRPNSWANDPLIRSASEAKF